MAAKTCFVVFDASKPGRDRDVTIDLGRWRATCTETSSLEEHDRHKLRMYVVNYLSLELWAPDVLTQRKREPASVDDVRGRADPGVSRALTQAVDP